ncbi:MAG: hypothetical protein JNM63_08855, partial [Spirochaetia bacterium]|nr:hypothetical protein [Spirochaetia bacterium]
APKTRFHLLENAGDFVKIDDPDAGNTGWILFQEGSLTKVKEASLSSGVSFEKPEWVRFLSVDGSLESAAQNLYAVLRELDAMGLEAIYAEKAPSEGLGLAINDRLLRAAGKG